VKSHVADDVEAPNRPDVLGVPVFVGDLDRAVGTVIARATSRRGGFVCQCNVHVLVEAERHDDVLACLREAWCVFPDGAPVAWLQRRLGYGDARQVAGPDLMFRLLDEGQRDGLRHFFLGSTVDTLALLRERLALLVPGAELVGEHAPPFVHAWTPDDRVVSTVRDADPHVIWCALGAPKQELWMCRHAALFPSSLLVGVGAAVDFHAGVKARAPRWMRRVGLEWLHRFVSEPRRLGPRYLSTNVRFAALVGAELVRRHVRHR
jgi:N-acetylglucosaminyldiphosphoundecaprenol N-acetyl-beta-D-mannosaminyltransferase